MRDKLRKWREDNCRNSEQIVDVGEELISDHGSKLGDDSKCLKTKYNINQYIMLCHSTVVFLASLPKGFSQNRL